MKPKSYEDRLAEALQGAPMRRLLPLMVQWKVNDQRIVGKIVKIDHVKGKKDKDFFKMYSMETDQCLAKFTLGAQIDQIYPGDELLEKILVITYLGTTDIGGGKHMKSFDIQELPKQDPEIFDGRD